MSPVPGTRVCLGAGKRQEYPLKNKTLFSSHSNISFRKRLADKFVVSYLAGVRERLTDLRGQEFAVLANDWVGLQISVDGIYEREQLIGVFSFLAPLASIFIKGRALDIGANVGNHTIFFASRFAEVHAFEPGEVAHDLLVLNTKRRENVHTHRLALGSTAGTGRLVAQAGNLGASTVSPIDEGSSSGGFAIAPLDQVKLLSQDCSIELMKVDVEGFELDVINGALDTIRRDQPVILIEQRLQDFAGIDSETPALSCLRREGYAIVWFAHVPKRQNWIFRARASLAGLLRGRSTVHLVAGPCVPAGDHSMLIAVPTRYQATLGIST